MTSCDTRPGLRQSRSRRSPVVGQAPPPLPPMPRIAAVIVAALAVATTPQKATSQSALPCIDTDVTVSLRPPESSGHQVKSKGHGDRARQFDQVIDLLEEVKQNSEDIAALIAPLHVSTIAKTAVVPKAEMCCTGRPSFVTLSDTDTTRPCAATLSCSQPTRPVSGYSSLAT
jgi:hypothetical protein